MITCPNRTVRVYCRTCGAVHYALNGAWIAWARAKHGITLKALAGAAGISVQYLHDLEHGRRRATSLTGLRVFNAVIAIVK